MIDRQRLVGWIMVVLGAGYLLYFIKVRMLADGTAITRGEWMNVVTSLAVFFIGTANVRLAAMRQRRRHTDLQQ